jgi:hypothetical protein
VPELGPLGSVRGASSNGRPYREPPNQSVMAVVNQYASATRADDRQWSESSGTCRHDHPFAILVYREMAPVNGPDSDSGLK